MVTWSSLTAALGAVGVGLLLSASGAVATPGLRNSASPSYRSAEVCPERCSVSGPQTGNWSVYPDFKQIKKCKQTMFYDFSLYDPVNDKAENHKIYACSSFGPDFSQIPASATRLVSAESVDVEFVMGWWEEGFGLATSGLRSLVKQMRWYAENGHGSHTDRPFVLYGQSGQATIGVYVGQGLLNQDLSKSALKIFQDNFEDLNVSTPSLAMQLCDQGYDSTHIFGVVATNNGLFTPIQNAIKSWANATCLSFEGFTQFPGTAMFTTPLVHAKSTTTTTTTTNSTTVARKLYSRAECRTIEVYSGNGCAELAERCGISGADFTKYNPGDDFCSTLQPKQHVCCSEGELPSFRPEPNDDGSCYAYQIKGGDNCYSIAVEYSLTLKDLEDFNKNTWGWNGCKLLFKDAVMCLSKGTPPFPAPIANAVCGPQKPGSKPPTDGSDIADLNPCPLNACCNIWGQCGITKDFCIDTNTGAPGTAEPGTYGCISNCGMDVVKGDGNGAIKIGYYEGYGLSRKCLFQDAFQIDTSLYTHVHFGFGTLTPSYDVETGDALSTFEFGEFKRIPDTKRILSFGGWDFSTSPKTYQIFRNGVKAENRIIMATKIANFIKANGLDGVDIDWEYPGAPDLPEFDPGTEEEGANYLAFLVVLKDLLPNKSVSIAVPSSYWYLKQLPIAQISKVVDYIVCMTYDLHGQWDAHNRYSQEGCDAGNSLRSHVNLTETRQSLAMITKADVPGKKVIVGVASYGRSFKMAEAGCWGPDCLFTGDRLNSNAKKGKCTDTAGYIAYAEIAEILNEILNEPNRVVKHFFDSSSNKLYSSWGLGGTADWATDLQEYHDVPAPAKSWGSFKKLAYSGKNPTTDTSRNGNWTDWTCTHPYIVALYDYTPSERWKELNADAAWDDVVRIWQDTDRQRNIDFFNSVASTLGMQPNSKCGWDIEIICEPSMCPDKANDFMSGPAAQLVWNSLVQIHNLYAEYYAALFNAASTSIPALKDLENKFAPIPVPEDDTWVLLLIDIITLGTLGTAGPFFNTVLKNLDYFLQEGSALDNLKDTTMTIIGQSATVAKDVLPKEKSRWTPADQDTFTHYMGNVVRGWANISSLALMELFRGGPEALGVFEDTMSNGKLIAGKRDRKPLDSTTLNATLHTNLVANIEKCFFGYAIPALWQVSKTYAFIINAGYRCDEGKKLSDYLDDDTMDATGACVDGGQYYLAYPKGDAVECHSVCYDHGPCQRICKDNKFSAPPGLDSLDGTNFGHITRDDLVKGSVRTWFKNGKENGHFFADPTNEGTMENLMNVDVTTPGFMRIPVCSPERAFQSWDTANPGSSDFYPCDIPLGKDTCGKAEFVNQTSDGSPKVDDCLTIIKNIEGDASSDWTTEVVGKPHNEILSYGSCAFGVEATTVGGNVNFVVGAQDVIDIIKDAVRMFTWEGKVGAKGTMECNGNIKSQPVKWGIY